MTVELRQNPPSSDTQLIPLINVVFLMLAFFMIAGQIQRPDSVLLETPISESESDRQSSPITIAVTKEERIYVNGTLVLQEELVNHISEMSDEIGSPSSPTILLRADARLAAVRTRAILGALRETGIGEVSLATLHTSGFRE